MADLSKTVVPGKVDKESDKKFKIKKDKADEADIDIEVLTDGEYQVDKLETNRLPKHMPDGTFIHWFNNFSIRENGQYINKRYRVRIRELSDRGHSRLVIYNGNGDLYYYQGVIDGDTFELDDGDPAAGQAP